MEKKRGSVLALSSIVVASLLVLAIGSAKLTQIQSEKTQRVKTNVSTYQTNLTTSKLKNFEEKKAASYVLEGNEKDSYYFQLPILLKYQRNYYDSALSADGSKIAVHSNSKGWVTSGSSVIYSATQNLLENPINTSSIGGYKLTTFTESGGVGSGAEWEVSGRTYAVGDIVSYDGQNYECTMAHTTVNNPSWAPDLFLAAWTPTSEEIPEPSLSDLPLTVFSADLWEISGHTYSVGDVVSYNGVIYQCVGNHTTNGDPNWAPGPYTIAMWVLAPGLAKTYTAQFVKYIEIPGKTISNKTVPTQYFKYTYTETLDTSAGSLENATVSNTSLIVEKVTGIPSNWTLTKIRPEIDTLDDYDNEYNGVSSKSFLDLLKYIQDAILSSQTEYFPPLTNIVNGGDINDNKNDIPNGNGSGTPSWNFNKARNEAKSLKNATSGSLSAFFSQLQTDLNDAKHGEHITDEVNHLNSIDRAKYLQNLVSAYIMQALLEEVQVEKIALTWMVNNRPNNDQVNDLLNFTTILFDKIDTTVAELYSVQESFNASTSESERTSLKNTMMALVEKTNTLYEVFDEQYSDVGTDLNSLIASSSGSEKTELTTFKTTEYDTLKIHFDRLGTELSTLNSELSGLSTSVVQAYGNGDDDNSNNGNNGNEGSGDNETTESGGSTVNDAISLSISGNSINFSNVSTATVSTYSSTLKYQSYDIEPSGALSIGSSSVSLSKTQAATASNLSSGAIDLSAITLSYEKNGKERSVSASYSLSVVGNTVNVIIQGDGPQATGNLAFTIQFAQ